MGVLSVERSQFLWHLRGVAYKRLDSSNYDNVLKEVIEYMRDVRLLYERWKKPKGAFISQSLSPAPLLIS